MTQPLNDSPPHKTLSPVTRKIIGVLLLIFGFQLWLICGRAILGHNYQWLALLVVIALTAIPPIARYVALALDSIRRWTGRYPNLTAFLIAVAATGFLYNAAIVEGIPLFPHWEDEFVYLIQTQMMAHGRLWMHPHPMARFFDSLNLLTTHAYAGMYFPGTAILLAPTIWLGLPKCAGPLIVSGISAGLIFRVVAELLDGVSGILAALILVSLTIFRMVSTLVLSQGPMLMLGLLMVLAYLRWRNTDRSKRWLIVLSAAMGLAAITRPIDAFCYAAIIAIAMICNLRRQPLAVWIKTAAILLPIVLAFLSIQLIFNIGVTGHWYTTPYGNYIHREFPGIGLEFSAPPPDVHPESDSPHIHDFYIEFVRPAMIAHQADHLLPNLLTTRIPMLWDYGFPSAFFWILIPFAFLALFKKQTWVLSAVLPLALLVYMTWTFLPHYIVPFLPPIILIILLASPAAVNFFPGQTHRVQCAFTLGILALCVLSWPQLDRTVYDTNFKPTELHQINNTLQQINPPAIVLFHYHNGDIVNGRVVRNDIEIEPVYNFDVPWPDDAPIIRAHDRNANTSALGTPDDVNRPLYQYYAKIDPHRAVYLCDRLYSAFPYQLTLLGSVADLANETSGSNKTAAPK